MGAWSFAFFPLLDSRSPLAATIAITVGLLFQAVMYGPMAAFIAEMFPTRVRYSGSSAGYQLAGVVGGSLAPLIGVALLARYDHSLPVSLYTLLASVITVVAVVLARETAEARRPATRSTTGSGPGA